MLQEWRFCESKQFHVGYPIPGNLLFVLTLRCLRKPNDEYGWYGFASWLGSDLTYSF
jgi:hypothetical protein